MLSWTGYDANAQAKYRGFTIEAMHDESPTNPFEDWDGHWPMQVRYDGRFTDYDKTKTGWSIDSTLNRFSDAQLVHDQKAIATILDTTIEWITECFAEDSEPVGYCHDADVLRTGFDEVLADIRKSDLFRAWEQLYEILGIPCIVTDSTGYCQGDYAQLIIVATPEAQAELRSKPDDMSPEAWAETLHKDMQVQADLYTAWAWGNCWGWRVVDKNDEELDCCWGYYGDHDTSGLEEAAMEAIDCHIDRIRRRRIARLKELILNKVPISRRPALLAAIGEVPSHV